MDTKKLEGLLGQIQEHMLTNMLKDLKNPDKCTPQLYNAIIKELERNGIDCVPKAGQDENPLGKLMEGVKEAMGDTYEFRQVN